MTTKITVITGTSGTHQQNRSLRSRLLRVTAFSLFLISAMAAMSFTQDDTTKKSEEKTITQLTTSASDSCCMVTFANGVLHIVITNKTPFTADVRINNMDVHSWVNSMMAYSYKKINLNSIGLADYKMDVTFTRVETMNHKMAVAFRKNLDDEMLAADAELTEVFNQTVAAPLFSRLLNEETTRADLLMDKILGDDAENRMRAAQFSKAIGLEKECADADMDYMVNASELQNISPATGRDADQMIDDLLAKNTFKSILPVAAYSADKSMDEILKNSN